MAGNLQRVVTAPQLSDFQFRLDSRAAGPWRATWAEAAWDAVRAGYAVWVGHNEIKFDATQGAEIYRR